MFTIEIIGKETKEIITKISKTKDRFFEKNKKKKKKQKTKHTHKKTNTFLVIFQQIL